LRGMLSRNKRHRLTLEAGGRAVGDRLSIKALPCKEDPDRNPDRSRHRSPRLPRQSRQCERPGHGAMYRLAPPAPNPITIKFKRQFAAPQALEYLHRTPCVKRVAKRSAPSYPRKNFSAALSLTTNFIASNLPFLAAERLVSFRAERATPPDKGAWRSAKNPLPLPATEPTPPRQTDLGLRRFPRIPGILGSFSRAAVCFARPSTNERQARAPRIPKTDPSN